MVRKDRSSGGDQVVNKIIGRAWIIGKGEGKTASIFERLNNREISLVFAIKSSEPGQDSYPPFPFPPLSPRFLHGVSFPPGEGAECCVAGSSEAERTDVRRRNFLPYPAPPSLPPPFRSLLFLRRFASPPPPHPRRNFASFPSPPLRAHPSN